MPFDGIVTKATVEELQDKICGGRIMKIYQPTEYELIFTIRKNRKNHSLLLSIHPTYARFHLTNDKYTNPQEPPMFCMLMRKHIGGAIIDSIVQDGLERVITMNVRAVDEVGDASTKSLMIELMGRHSNIILLNEDKEYIIDSLKHVSSLQNRYRKILPGEKYILPPEQEKFNPLSITSSQFLKRIDFNQGKLDQQIVHILTGVSPFIARDMVTRMGLGSSKELERVFLDFQERLIKRLYQPAIYINKREDFHVLPILSNNEEVNEFSSVNEMLDHFYTGKAERDRVKQQARDLYRFIKNEYDKNKRKLKIHKKTLAKAKDADLYQRRGELLTAHLHLVKQGDKEVTVIDYYDPEQKEITIQLQTNKSPSANAQHFFTKYRKLLTSKKIVKKEMIKTRKEINYFNQLLQQLDRAREVDIEEIREELREEGYLKKRMKRKKKKKNTKPIPEQFMSSNGITIFVGKNNKQNEYVTQKVARQDDYWLHTKDIPGSHVIIRSNQPDEDTLLEAAQLAAYYSQAGQSSSVPVDYTRIRHVKKPNGAKPGFVTYSEQKTLNVTPKRLSQKETSK